MTNLSKRAIDLRQQMEQIRCDLAGNVSHLSDDAKTLTDYRYYVRQHPWMTVGAAAAVGFLLMPSKSKPQTATDPAMLEELLKKNQLVVQTKAEVNQKRGLIATGASLLAAAALRAAMNYAKTQATEKLINYAHVRQQATATANPAPYPTHPR